MLEKSQKIVLKLMNGEQNVDENLLKPYNLDLDDYFDLCETLIEDGFTSKKIKENGETVYYTTYKGRHHLKFRLLSCVEFWVKSVVIPLIISVLTTILTLNLSGFFN